MPSFVNNQMGRNQPATPPPNQTMRIAIAVAITIVVIVGTIFYINKTGSSSPLGSPGQVGQLALPQAPTVQQPATPADWPQFLYNNQGYAANPNETVLSPTNVANLALVSSFDVIPPQPLDNQFAKYPTINGIVSTTVVVGDMMYFGSSNGTYYAVNQKTHQIVWTQNMGFVIPKKGCNPEFAGISSKAAIVDGILYVGGADGKVYALHADTGKPVWIQQITALIPAHQGYDTPNFTDEYLWSSPVVGNGHVYIGVSSYGDCPLIGGHLMMLDLQSGAIQASHWTEKVNEGGVTIWGRPVLDPDDQAVLYATGSLSSGPETDSMVELDWNTLAYKTGNPKTSIYTVPLPDQGENNAFGASCMLIPNLGGYHALVCHSKATRLYAVKITPNGLVAGWAMTLGETDGQAPEFGFADVGEVAFDGKSIYVGTTRATDAKGVKHPGAAYSIDAATRQVNWVTYFDGIAGDPANTGDGWPMTAPAVANGIVAFGLGQGQYNAGNPNGDFSGKLVVLDAKTGKELYKHPLSFYVYGAPIIVNGQIYVPSDDGHLYIFGLQNVPPADIFNQKQLDHQWKWLNNKSDSATLTGNNLSIKATGQALDAQNLLLTGIDQAADVDLTTTVTFSPQAQYEQAGMVLYQSTNAFVKFDYLKVNTNEYRFELTQISGGKTQSVLSATTFPPGVAYKLELVRLNGAYYAYVSADNGVTWTTITTTPATFTVRATEVGIFAYGGGQTAQFQSFVETPLLGTVK